MKPNNTFKHPMNADQDGGFFNLEDTVKPALERAAAINEGRCRMREMGIPKASKALLNLWKSSRDTLSPEQLSWYSELSDAASWEAENIADHLNELGSLINSVEEAMVPSQEKIATLLFSLANQVEIIAALVDIATSAEERLHESTQQQVVTATNTKPD
jgi:hypothetical protein